MNWVYLVDRFAAADAAMFFVCAVGIGLMCVVAGAALYELHEEAHG